MCNLAQFQVFFLNSYLKNNSLKHVVYLQCGDVPYALRFEHVFEKMERSFLKILNLNKNYMYINYTYFDT